MPRLLLFFSSKNALKACIFTSDGIFFFVIFIDKRDSVCCLHWIGSLAWNSTITPVSSFFWVRVGCLLSDTVFSTVFFLGFFFVVVVERWHLNADTTAFFFYHQNTCEFSMSFQCQVCVFKSWYTSRLYSSCTWNKIFQWNHSRPLQSPQCENTFIVNYYITIS